VYGVERAPQGVESFLGGGDDFVVAAFGVFFEPGAPGGAMKLVGLFVDSEIGESFGTVDAVELFQAVDLGGRDFGDLGFIGVEGGDGFRHRAVPADSRNLETTAWVPGSAGQQVMSSA
jgi:hypothetical protein